MKGKKPSLQDDLFGYTPSLFDGQPALFPLVDDAPRPSYFDLMAQAAEELSERATGWDGEEDPEAYAELLALEADARAEYMLDCSQDRISVSRERVR